MRVEHCMCLGIKNYIGTQSEDCRLKSALKPLVIYVIDLSKAVIFE